MFSRILKSFDRKNGTGQTVTSLPTFENLELRQHMHAGDLSSVFNGGSASALTDGDGYTVGVGSQDGKVIVAGQYQGEVAVARFTKAGALDSTFGNNGIALVPVGTYAEPSSMKVNADGQIVVVGTDESENGDGMFALRLKKNGQLDHAFNASGISIIKGEYDVTAATLDTTGNVYLTGAALETGGDYFIAKFTTNGAPDGSFDGNGLRDYHVAYGNDNMAAIAVDSHGNIVVAGEMGLQAVVARVRADSSPDDGFGVGGTVLEPLTTNANEQYWGVTIGANDAVIAVGGATLNDGTGVSLIREYTITGEAMPSFGNAGTLQFTGSRQSELFAVTVDANQKIVATGFSYGYDSGSNYSSSVMVTRINTNGTLDHTFGTQGIVTVNGGTYDEGIAVAIEDNGKIDVVLGDETFTVFQFKA